jgi:hypothetical protein
MPRRGRIIGKIILFSSFSLSLGYPERGGSEAYFFYMRKDFSVAPEDRASG